MLQRLSTDKVPNLLELQQHFAPVAEQASGRPLPCQGTAQHPLEAYDALMQAPAVEVH